MAATGRILREKLDRERPQRGVTILTLQGDSDQRAAASGAVPARSSSRTGAVAPRVIERCATKEMIAVRPE